MKVGRGSLLNAQNRFSLYVNADANMSIFTAQVNCERMYSKASPLIIHSVRLFRIPAHDNRSARWLRAPLRCIAWIVEPRDFTNSNNLTVTLSLNGSCDPNRLIQLIHVWLSDCIKIFLLHSLSFSEQNPNHTASNSLVLIDRWSCSCVKEPWAVASPVRAPHPPKELSE